MHVLIASLPSYACVVDTATSLFVVTIWHVQQSWVVCLTPESPPEETGGVQFVGKGIGKQGGWGGEEEGDIEMNSVFDVGINGY